jgi:WD40 repeat protein
MLDSILPHLRDSSRLFASLVSRTFRAGSSMIPDLLMGYDFFISYSRRDGATYARDLLAELRSKGFRCFLDESELGGGDKLTSSLARSLRRSRALVLVATERAILHSAFVRDEVSGFAPYERPIIPISVAGTFARHLAQSPLAVILSERIWIDDQEATSGHVAPSKSVISEIARSYSFIRRARIRQAFAWSLVAVFSVLALSAEIQRRTAESNRQTAVSRQLAAQSVSVRAEQLDLSLLLAIAANAVSDTGEAASSLVAGLTVESGIVRYLRGHRDSVFAVAAGSGGTPIVSGGLDGEVRIWPDLRSRSMLLQPARSSPVGSIVFDPTGRLLTADLMTPSRIVFAIAHWDGTIVLADAALARQIAVLPRPRASEGPVHIALAEDVGDLFAAYKSGELYRWRRDGSPRQPELVGRSNLSPTRISVSADGKRVAIGTSEGILAVALQSKEGWSTKVRVIHAQDATEMNAIHGLALSRDGSRIAAADRSGQILVYPVEDLEKARPIVCPGHANDTYAMRFAHGDQRLVSGGNDGAINISSLATGCSLERRLQANGRSIQAVALDDRSELSWLVSGSGDRSVVVWKLPPKGTVGLQSSERLKIPLHIEFVGADHLILAGEGLNQSGYLRIFDASNLQPLGPPVPDLGKVVGGSIVRPGGNQAFVFSPVGISVLNLRDTQGPKATLLKQEDDDVAFYRPATTPDVSLIATLDTERRVGVYATAKGSFLWRKPLKDGIARGAVDIDPHGELVAVPDEDYAVRLLSARDGRTVGEPLRAHRLDVTSVRFSADARILYTGGLDGRLIAWDVVSGSQLSALPGRIGSVQTIAASRDGVWLAAGNHDGRILLWRLADRVLVATFRLSGPVTALAFDPASQKLAGADVEGRIAIWPTSPDEWRSAACDLAGRDLTSDERTLFVGRDLEAPLCAFSRQPHGHARHQ